jgi:integrase
VYRSFLDNHVLPKWGDTLIRDVQPRPVELWLRQLPLAPKSKTHVRSLLHSLVDFAMWAGILEIARNPISLVVNKGATKRVRKARSLTAEQFGALLSELHEPFATMALLCVCLGLRISEALALRWSDIDWLGSKLSIRRGIVEQHVDECKTEGSAKALVLAEGLLARLKAWKQASQFRNADDWVFASSHSIGRLPYSYSGTRDELARAAKAAGIGPVSTHAFRHTYRSWLDATGAPISVQQKMMRHASIKTTMDIYGDVVTDEMTTAGRKVAQLVFPVNGAQAERKAS